ncbi:MAG: imidazole glycerol phosphate synthase subunit HisH [Candidatus Endolissoclinum sp. TMED37]|nr:MAG: imidazole glycerol phosphate synthase subunit HisH [Candidatus Endolissoclinum sp. TMED37]
MKKKVAIINFGMGNLNSVQVILNYLAIKNDILENPQNINNYSHVVLPGVGSFKKAVKNLKKNGFFNTLLQVSKNKNQKILGICLGMQLLFESSTEEGNTKGLGILKGKVEKFSFSKVKNIKIPHVGFNQVFFHKKNSFYKDISIDSDFYFDHSYRVTDFGDDSNSGFTNYGEKFLSSFNKGNIFGTQFHPEKSQSNGLLILRNFLNN